MSEYSQMLGAIKRAATEAVAAAKPFALTYGTVKTISPLTIAVDQKLELTESQLLPTNAVRDCDVQCTVNNEQITVRLHLGLRPAEKVLLLRIQGGQQYIVLDRVEAP